MADFPTTGDDIIVGTTDPDNIDALAGNDQVSGLEGNDTLTGGEGNDTLNGGDGDDQLTGGAGVDEQHGGAGDDTFYVNTAAELDNGEIYDGGDGNDTLYLQFGDVDISNGPTLTSIETLQVNGNLTLRAAQLDALNTINASGITLSGAGSVDLAGQQINTSQFNLSAAGNTLNLSSQSYTTYTVNGGDGDDTVIGSLTQSNFVTGNGGNDNLTGGNFADYLTGGEGNDTLNGGDGDDQLTGGAGVDEQHGGAGDDTFYVNTAAELDNGEIYDGGDGNDTLYLQFGDVDISNGPTLTSIETLQVNGNLTLRAAQLDALNTINASGITLSGAGSVDLAGQQINTSQFNLSAAGNTLNLSSQSYTTYTVNGGDGDDTVIGSLTQSNFVTGNGGNDNLTGGNFADYLTGGEGNDTLNGGDGDDQLTGGAGVDEQHGGAGDDTFYVNTAAELDNGEIYDGGDGNDTLYLQFGDVDISNGPTLTSIETLQVNGNLTLRAAQLDALNTINASGITLSGAGSVDLAGQQINTSQFNLSAAGNTLNLSSQSYTTYTVNGGDGDDTVIGSLTQSNFVTGNGGNDNLTGGNFADYLTGGEGNDTLNGGDGDDQLTGGAGVDEQHGGAGDDTFYVNTAAELDNGEIYDGGDGNDTLYLQFGDVDISNGPTLTSIETLQVNGNLTLRAAQLDALNTINASGITLSGAGSVDLAGQQINTSQFNLSAAGNTLNLSSQSYTTYTVNGGDGDDTVIGSLTQSNFVTGNGGNDNLTGGNFADYLTGGEGNDTLNGGDGDDQLTGGAGVDEQHGGAGDDTFYVNTAAELDNGEIYDGGDGNDTLYLQFGDVDISNGPTLTSIETLQVNGNLTLRAAQLDALNTINASGITLSGAGSVDLAGQQINTSQFNLSAAGNTLNLSSQSYTTYTVNGGDGDDTVIGSLTQSNFVTGNGGNDNLTGGNFADYLTGGEGNDTLNGGDGDDQLTGGEGNDTFAYTAGTDTIYDFGNGIDRVDLRSFGAITSFADVLARIDQNDHFSAVITFSPGQVLTLSGVDWARLTPGQFLLASGTSAPIGPLTDADSSGNFVAENSAVGTEVGVTAFASDPDAGDTVSYTITANPENLFAIDGHTGVVTTAAPIDYETGGLRQVQIAAISSDGSVSTETFNIAIGDIDEAPVAEDYQIFMIEDLSNSFIRENFLFADPDNGGVNALAFVTILSVPDHGTLSFNGTPLTSQSIGQGLVVTPADLDDGKLLFTADPDTSGANYASFQFSVASSSSPGTSISSVPATMLINVGAVDDAPVIASNGGGDAATVAVAENTAAVTTVAATDVDDAVLTYSIDGGADAALFQIDPQSGALTFKTAPNFEAAADANGDNIYDVIVRASDPAGAHDTQAIAVTVTDVAVEPTNQAPTANPETVSTPEDVSARTDITALLSNDTDPDGPLSPFNVTFGNATHGTITNGGGFNGGSAYFTPDPNFAGDASYDYTVNDGSGGQSTTTVSVHVAPVADTPLLGIGTTDTFWTPTQAFSVEQQSVGSHLYPEAVALSDGGYAVTWWDYSNHPDTTVKVRVFNDDGTPRTDEMTVNQAATPLEAPRIAATGDGGFIIAWKSSAQAEDPDGVGIHGRKFDASGSPTTSEVALADAHDYNEQSLQLVGLKGGGFVLSTFVEADAGFGRPFSAWLLYDDAGSLVKTVAAYHDVGDPVAGALSDGGFVIALRTTDGIAVQRFDADGAAIDELDIGTLGHFEGGTLASHGGSLPVVDGLADGSNYVVAWYQPGTTGTPEIHVRTFIDGVMGEDTVVASGVAHRLNGVTGLDDGGFIVNWTALPDIWAQRYDAAAQPMGDAFQLPDSNESRDFGESNLTPIVQLPDGRLVSVFASSPIPPNVDIGIHLQEFAGNAAELASATGTTGGNLSLPLIHASLVDTDGSETLAIHLSGFPVGSVFSVGSLDGGTGEWVISNAVQIAALGSVPLTVTPPVGFAGSFELEVRAISTDSAIVGGTPMSDTSEISGTISVTVAAEPNHAPVITSNGGGETASANAPENQTGATTVVASDPDADPVSYSIAGGADGSMFTIDASTGVLTFTSAPDYETPTDANVDNAYEVLVRASDGVGGVDFQSITVTVTDVNEGPANQPPAFTSSPDRNINENSLAIGIVTATDPDAGDVLTYSIVGGEDGGFFEIDPASGALSFRSLPYYVAPDYEDPRDTDGNNVYELTVRVDDGHGHLTEQNIHVRVNNLNSVHIEGTAGADLIDAAHTVIGQPFPGNEDDDIIGHAGNDTISGLQGNDYIVGGQGSDAIDGGSGNDRVDYSHEGGTGGIVVNLSNRNLNTANGDPVTIAAHSAIDSFGNVDTLVSIEGVRGTGQADVFIGTEDQIVNFEGLAGNDRAYGGAGNEFVNPGSGNDSFVDSSSDDADILQYYQTGDDAPQQHGIIVNGTANQSGTVIDPWGDTDTYVQVEKINGTSFADVFNGGVDRNRFVGFAGNDSFNGGAGDSDEVHYHDEQFVDQPGQHGVIVNLSNQAIGPVALQGLSAASVAAHTAIDTFGDVDSLTSIENIRATPGQDYLVGDEGHNEFVGEEGDDILIGNGGNDEFTGDAGADLIDGGEGDRDRVNYDEETRSYKELPGSHGVIVNLSDLDMGVVSVAGIDPQVVAAHHAIDTHGDTDTLIGIERVDGTKFNDLLIGSDVDNQLEGGAGDDVLFGGIGYDELIGGDGNDVIYGNGLGGPDTQDYIEAGAGDDIIYAADDVKGWGDFILPGLGNNQIIATPVLTPNGLDGHDLSFEDLQVGVVVDLTAGVATAPGMHTTFSSVHVVHGSRGDDVLTGGQASHDHFEGFSGGAGNDTIDGGSGWDRVDYRHEVRSGYIDENGERVFGHRGAVVDLETGVAVDTYGDTDTLISIEALRGSNYRDEFRGTSGDNSFQGYAGNDLIDGRGGFDFVQYDDQDEGGGAVVVNLGAGVATDGFGNTDTLISIEGARGSQFADTLIGSEVGNYFEGGAGDDTITAAGGDDYVVGGAGNDAIDSGADSDTVEYTGNRADYAVTAVGGGFRIADLRAGAPDGTDMVTSVERFVFADGALSASELLPNSPPVITSNGGGDTAVVTTPENSTTVTTVTATDADAGDTLAYAITGGADQGLFHVDAATGALSFVSAPNFESPTDANGDNVYEVVVQATDGTLVDTQVISVTVGNANEAPVIISNGGGDAASTSVTEGDTAVTTNVATDPDAGTTITYTIAGGADAARFTIDSASGVLSFVSAPDFEAPADAGANNVYDVVVTASDGSLSDSQAIAVTVADSGNVPSLDLNGAGSGLNVTLDYTEQQAATLMAPEATVTGDGFAGGSLRVNQTFAAGTDRFTIRDVGTSAGEIGVTGNTVSYAGAPLGTFTGGTGGNDLVITFGAAATAEAVQALVRAIQYENGQGDNPSGIPRTLTLVLDDGVAGTDIPPATATVNVIRVNDLPVVGLGNALNYTENQPPTAIAPNATLTDPDATWYDGGSLTVRFSANATPADQLSIGNVGTGPGQIGVNGNSVAYQGVPFGTFSGGANGADLVVTFFTNTAPTPAAVEALLQNITYLNSSDSPDAATRAVTFTVVDSFGGSGSDAANVLVIPVNDPPTITSSGGGDTASIAVAENHTPVTTVSATDPDSASLSYAIVGGADSANFRIDGTTGALSFVNAPDFETHADADGNNVYEVTVSASDGTLFDTQAISVTVTDGTGVIIIGTDGGDQVDATHTVAGQPLPTNDGDTILGNGGNDVVDAGAGADTIQGGEGNDILIGNLGADRVFGGAGNDLLVARGGTATTNATEAGEVYDGGDGFDTLVIEGGAYQGFTFVGSTLNSIEALRFDPRGGAESVFFQANQLGLGLDDHLAVTGNPIKPAFIYILMNSTATVDLSGWSFTDWNTELPAAYDDGRPTVQGSTGADTIIGSSQFDVLNANGGDDNLTGGGGDDELEGSSGTDTAHYSGNRSDYAISSEAGRYHIVDLRTGSPDGADLVGGVEFFQFANVTLSADQLLQGTAPTITSNGGGDTASVLIAENGNAVTTVVASDPDAGTTLGYSVSGGADASRFHIDQASGVLTFVDAPDFEAPADANGDNVYDVVVRASDGSLSDTQAIAVTVTNVAGITVNGSNAGTTINGTPEEDVLNGNGGNDIINGLAGNDTINGGAGTDTMAGGPGDDTYTVAQAGDVVTELAAQGTDTILSSVTYTAPANVENLTLTGTGNTNATGNDLSNVLTGNSGNNVLNGLASADAMAGGAGNDTYVVDDLGDIVTEQPGGGTDLVQSSVSFVLGANIENLTLTGAGNANATGNSASNSLIGNAGNNILDGAGGIDTMAGGAGNDTYVTDGGDTITEAGNAGADTVEYVGTGSFALGANLENLVLGPSALNGTGNTLANTITGNALGNSLNGGTGADTLIGLGGDDTYVVDNAGDVVAEQAGQGNDTVESSINYTLGANLEMLRLTGTANRNGTGNELANILVGNSGNNTLDGMGGADVMGGGAGNDTYVVDNAGDVVSEGAAEGDDLVQTSVSFALGFNVERLTLTGTAAINGTGNLLDNTITGNAANNILDGGTGADTMAGGLGDDTYLVDNVADVVTEAADAGTDTIIFNETAGTYTLGANVENLTLAGSSAINGAGNGLANIMLGNAAANTLSGGGGADFLDGGAGADTMIGGAGNDTYVVDDEGDVVSEAGTGGTDTVLSSVSFSLIAGGPDVQGTVENLTLTGTGNISGTGNSGANALLGNAGDNFLFGGGGADSINGGAGNDFIIGSTGHDILTGGIGADTFDFNVADFGGTGGSIASHSDQIFDFNAAEGDVLDFAGLLDDALNLVGGDEDRLIRAQFSGDVVLIQINERAALDGSPRNPLWVTAVTLQDVDDPTGVSVQFAGQTWHLDTGTGLFDN